MAKKTEVKKVRPSEAIRSLESYNEKVFMLVQQCLLALQRNFVDKAISESMRDALNEVQSFYTEEVDGLL